MPQHFTYAVIGGGIEGSATAYYLAKNGYKAVLIEQFRQGHTRGSSHGNSRITRKAYLDPVYVEMMKKAYRLWDDLERESREQLYKQTGLLYLGLVGGQEVDMVTHSMAVHKLPFESLTSKEICEKYPQLKFDSTWRGVYDPAAGLLKADRCLNALQTQFVKNGGVLRHGESVTYLEPGKVIKIETASGNQYTCDGVALCLGTWSKSFIDKFLGLKLPLQPRVVKSCYWKVDKKDQYSVANGFPCFISTNEINGHKPTDIIYGVPSDEYPDLVKICSHEGVDINHPDERDSIDASLYIQKPQHYIFEHCKNVHGKPAIVETCMYTITPDDNFVLDTHPEYGNVAICSVAGHGFKFAPVVGEIMGSLLLRRPTFDLTLFSIGRFEKEEFIKNKL